MRTDVRFPSSGMTLAGHLYTPDNPVTEPLPAIVVGHPFTGVKEQTSGLYAQRLADKGFIALAFDAAYQGESEGLPRGLENPFQRAEDVRNAVSYLTTRDDVDSERIGALGICASGGYVPFAAQTDNRMKAVATVSAVNLSPFMAAFPDYDAMLAGAGRLRSEEAAGREPKMSSPLPESVDASTPAAMQEFFEYYRTPRAQHPRSTGYYVQRSLDQLAQYDSYATLHLLAPRPLLMIAGTAAETLPFSQIGVEQAGSNAELFTIEGATHVDLYDVDEYVTPAVAKLTEFFGERLSQV
ncbi:alpha/beta hydrolase [Streptomyces sp. NPDC058385]|uniref:alpha/beta hydrolase n=1 Tax=Streptomyces sp. NPDC058385 TaxID=3346473 RepID=UPI0036492874